MENIPLAWSGRCCWLVVKIIKKFGLHCFFLNNLLIYNLTLSAFFSHFKKLFIRIAKQERKNFLNQKTPSRCIYVVDKMLVGKFFDASLYFFILAQKFPANLMYCDCFEMQMQFNISCGFTTLCEHKSFSRTNYRAVFELSHNEKFKFFRMNLFFMMVVK